MAAQALRIETGRDEADVVRLLLEDQRDRLTAAIEDCPDICTTNLAKSYLGRVLHALANPPGAMVALRGFYGHNGWEPAIDSVCRSAAFHKADRRAA